MLNKLWLGLVLDCFNLSFMDLFCAVLCGKHKIPLLLMNWTPARYLFWNMEEERRGDEGYKDGCWTPIREGLSLVRCQSGERASGGSIIINIQRPGETLSHTPLWGLMSVVMGISSEPPDRNSMVVCSHWLSVLLRVRDIAHAERTWDGSWTSEPHAQLSQ